MLSFRHLAPPPSVFVPRCLPPKPNCPARIPRTWRPRGSLSPASEPQLPHRELSDANRNSSLRNRNSDATLHCSLRGSPTRAKLLPCPAWLRLTLLLPSPSA